MKRIAVIVAMVVATGALAAPAAAGGSVWDLDRPWYRPGEPAELLGIVAWEHNAALGRPGDGPYVVHLVPVADDCYGCIPANGLLLGELTVEEEPYVADDGARYGPFHAWLRFTVPELPAGEYAITHCNVPCTTTLGDLTWGRLRIVGPTFTTVPSRMEARPI